MTHRLIYTGMIVVLASCLAGCGIKGAPPETRALSPEEILEAWKEIPKAGLDNMDTTTAVFLAQRLSEFGTEALTPLIDVIGNPESSPDAKILAVISLTPLLEAGMVPRLNELTAPGLDSTTRSCAAHLLGLIESPESVVRLRQLSEDAEQQVRMAAIIVLVMRQDPEILRRLPEIWQDPHITAKQREDLSYVLPDDFASGHLDLMASIVTDEELAMDARQRAILFLGRHGDDSVLPALRRCVDTATDPELRELAAGAIAAIEERAASGNS